MQCFWQKNGYFVSAFDATDKGIEKAKQLADKAGVYVEFFQGKY